MSAGAKPEKYATDTMRALAWMRTSTRTMVEWVRLCGDLCCGGEWGGKMVVWVKEQWQRTAPFCGPAGGAGYPDPGA